MSFFSAVIFFIFYKKYTEKFDDQKLWFIFSIISIILLPAAFYYSTFADRIAIYFIPLQLVVLSRIPVLIRSPYNRTIFIFGVICMYVTTLYVWLNFGNYSSFWLPYGNALFL
jgi:membrane-associated HD superfamily phosphohydrolase